MISVDGSPGTAAPPETLLAENDRTNRSFLIAGC